MLWMAMLTHNGSWPRSAASKAFRNDSYRPRATVRSSMNERQVLRSSKCFLNDRNVSGKIHLGSADQRGLSPAPPHMLANCFTPWPT